MPRPSRNGLHGDDPHHLRRDPRLKDLAIACMLNSEAAAIVAALRRPILEPSSQLVPATPEELPNYNLLHSLNSLRAFVFHPNQGEWRTTNPAVYLSPFLDVIQSDDVRAAATGLALSAVCNILKLDIFDERTIGAREAVHNIVYVLTNCRLEHTDMALEDSVLMRVLHVLSTLMRARISFLLSDHAVCTIINTCFQVVQQSVQRVDLLQRAAKSTMNDLIQLIFSHLPELRTNHGGGDSGLEFEDEGLVPCYGAHCMTDIFDFLCSLLNVGESVDPGLDTLSPMNPDEDVQLFALTLINSAVELGGEGIGRYPRILRVIQDDLFYNLIHYSTRSSPLVLSMICSTVLNLYHFLRRSLRLQLEAFFTYVLLKIAGGVHGVQLQEVAVEAIISFCRQTSFAVEMYVNYDCDPIQQNVFEEVGKLLCQIAFPVGSPASHMQIQAFEGLLALISAIAESIEVDKMPPREAYNLDFTEYRPFWVAKCENAEDAETWVEFVRMRKLNKRKVMVAANHYNRDEKKGLAYLDIAHLVPSPPDPKSLAYFFRYTPGLDKNKMGDFLGDPGEFNLQVLKEFTETFLFSGLNLDAALRSYLETFRLPGESQKIQRILEAFSEHFYEQQSSELFVSKDSTSILCYSLIMLNTDQHNPQVKKKMTEDEFIRNNRGINGGKDFPREYLSELFRSISSNAITLSGHAGLPTEINLNRWSDLIKRSRAIEPFAMCDYKHKLSREIFIAIAGPSVATLCAIFEHTEDEDILHECVEGLISVARIARYGLEDVLDELLSCFSKFTTLLNPYATPEETLFTFSHELKPRMATLAFFTIANKFGESIRGAWKNMVDCLLKLKRLKLLPQSVLGLDDTTSSDQAWSESGVIFPSSHQGGEGNGRSISGLIGRFSHFLSLENSADSMLNAGSEFENNLKIIQQCQIGSIFRDSSRLPEEALQNLSRALIFSAAGKGQKFSTPVEEEETVSLCWDLLVTITIANLHRFAAFWPQSHDCFTVVFQFPLFSPCPFAEKAIIGLFKIAVKLFAIPHNLDRLPEELILKSINIMWKLDKEILDSCCKIIANSITHILNENSINIQTGAGWKTLLQLLSIVGRYPETFDQGVETLAKLMTERTHINRYNYPFCIEAALNFVALRISPLETSLKLLELMSGSVEWLVQWHKSGYSDSGSSNSSSSTEAGGGGGGGGGLGNLAANLFLKLAEAMRKISLVRREEIRNQAVVELGRCFASVDELELTPPSSLACFNLVIFAMVDDLHEKMVEYSQRENSEREMRSMLGTLTMAMELLVDVYLRFLIPLSQSPGFRTFWLGMLRRMDTCMKANISDDITSLQELVPVLLKKMIVEMKEKQILVQSEASELWDITNIQIQWIAPQLKDELFPDDF